MARWGAVMIGDVVLTIVAPAARQEVDSSRVATAMGALLLVVLVVVVVFLFGTHVLMRAARRHRATLDRRRTLTPCDDVWAMHKLPPGWEANAADGDPSDE